MATTTITKTASANITLTAGQWLVVSGDGTYTLGPGLYNGKIVGIVNGAKIGPFADTQTVSLCASVTDLVYYTQSAPIGTYPMSLDPASGLITDPAQRAAVQEAGSAGGSALSEIRRKPLLAKNWLKKTRLFGVSATGTPTVYWPWVFPAYRYLASPLGKYYMFWSTDHGSGGIYLSTADSVYGPWTHRGQVFYDTQSSDGGETAAVLYDHVNGNFRLFYHCAYAKYGAGGATSANGGQSTLSATSTDLVNWTKDPNFILDVPAGGLVRGDGHTGYFYPCYTRNGLIAHSLYGSGQGFDSVMWRHGFDLSSWETNSISLGYGLDATDGIATTNVIERHHSFIFDYAGTQYVVGLLTNNAYSGNAKVARVFISEVSANYRQVLSKPQIIWQPTLSWESDNIRSITHLVEDGKLYVFYSMNKTDMGVFEYVL